MKDRPSILLPAVAGAALMMAHHVASRSVRDALFLSSYSVSSLPAMMMVASLFSIALVVPFSVAITRFTPALTAPVSFAASTGFYGVVWSVLDQSPRTTAVSVSPFTDRTGWRARN